MSCEGDDQIDEIVNSIDAVIVDAAKKNKNKSKKNTDAAPREPVSIIQFFNKNSMYIVI
jgi:hypothetical protein